MFEKPTCYFRVNHMKFMYCIDSFLLVLGQARLCRTPKAILKWAERSNSDIQVGRNQFVVLTLLLCPTSRQHAHSFGVTGV